MSLNLVQPHLPSHMHNLTHIEASHFDYFRLVCAKDFALYFESASWESLLLRSAYLEPSIYNAALAIAALSRQYYSPTQFWYGPCRTKSAVEFSMVRYNLAVRTLNGRLEESAESSELAVLASVLFIKIEAFQKFREVEGFPNLIFAHLNGGLAILHYLKSLSRNIDYLETGLGHIRNQIEQFEQFST
jgi:hypothetical protein